MPSDLQAWWSHIAVQSFEKNGLCQSKWGGENVLWNGGFDGQSNARRGRKIPLPLAMIYSSQRWPIHGSQCRLRALICVHLFAPLLLLLLLPGLENEDGNTEEEEMWRGRES